MRNPDPIEAFYVKHKNLYPDEIKTIVNNVWELIPSSWQTVFEKMSMSMPGIEQPLYKSEDFKKTEKLSTEGIKTRGIEESIIYQKMQFAKLLYVYYHPIKRFPCIDATVEYNVKNFPPHQTHKGEGWQEKAVTELLASVPKLFHSVKILLPQDNQTGKILIQFSH